jgi:hypothetical protein
MQIANTGWQPGIARDLGGGLRLRWSRSEDIPAIYDLVGRVFRENDEAPFYKAQANWIPELMGGDYPHMGPGDFALIEDIRPGEARLVAITCYWHHTWEYAGIPFRVGRPEFVATLPAYRQRGLVRALFAEVHARSQAEGDLAQAITGISYFYRQFGYEYALNLAGGRTVPLSLLPVARQAVPEAYLLRDALEEDIPLLQTLYKQQMQEQLVKMCIDDSWWRYQLVHWQTSGTGEHWHIQLIMDRTGQPWGYVVTPARRHTPHLMIWSLAIAPGANVLAMLPSLLRALQAEGQRAPAEDEAGVLTGIAFRLGQQHPIYEALGDIYAPYRTRSYAWYVRVPNLPRFLHQIASELEERLASSLLAGYTGGLKLDFYRSGLRLVFQQGRLLAAEDCQRADFQGSEDAGFPPQVFLQILFGYRSLEELEHMYPDVWASDVATLVLQTLFPKRPSNVISLG